VAPHRIAAWASPAPSRTSSCSSTPRCCRTCALALAPGRPKKSGSSPSSCSCRRCGAWSLEHREAVEKAIDFLDLQQYRDSLIVNLPYGVRKVTELARALCTDPRLLLLDEPSSGLNVEETEDMAFWIQDIRDLLGITVLMVEHDMSLVSAVSDRVLALNYGRPLALGTPAEVQAHPEVIRAYLGG
jgi:branched-chain amino acid transport system ATP-binding protein